MTYRTGPSIAAVVEVGAERFEELVGDALDGIPDGLGRLVDNVAVVVEDGRPDGPLLGRYEGIPLTERDTWYGSGGLTMPDRVTIFRLPTCAHCASEDEVVEQVRVTVLHELGHHLGFDEDRLDELGYG